MEMRRMPQTLISIVNWIVINEITIVNRHKSEFVACNVSCQRPSFRRRAKIYFIAWAEGSLVSDVVVAFWEFRGDHFEEV